MEGKMIKMAINPFSSSCYVGYDVESDTWWGPPGRGILLATDLERRLNFTSQLIYADGQWGVPVTHYDADRRQNVTHWSGIVGKLTRGEADWSPCSLYQTLRRAAVIDYSPTPYGIAELIAVAHIPEQDSAGERLYFNSLLKPLSTQDWFCFLTFLTIYALLITLLTQKLTQINKSGLLMSVINETIKLFKPFFEHEYAAMRQLTRQT